MWPLPSKSQALSWAEAETPRTLVALKNRYVLKRAREYSVHESRSAIPGQGGDTKLMALHMLSGRQRGQNAAHW